MAGGNTHVNHFVEIVKEAHPGNVGCSDKIFKAHQIWHDKYVCVHAFVETSRYSDVPRGGQGLYLAERLHFVGYFQYGFNHIRSAIVIFHNPYATPRILWMIYIIPPKSRPFSRVLTTWPMGLRSSPRITETSSSVSVRGSLGFSMA